VLALEQVYGYIYKYDELEAENRELRAQISLMEERSGCRRLL
jgi:cell division protein FtsB